MPISVKRQRGALTGLLGSWLPGYPEETGAADHPTPKPPWPFSALTPGLQR